MAGSPVIAPELVTALVPSLSWSLAEQFNVFRVMHHGTHEKQLSNVFAWLLNEQGTHQLGDAPQRIFLDLVNAALPEGTALPVTGYAVAQEVVTPGHEGMLDQESADIADIVLSSPEAAVVVENFGTSDGHGHDYRRYLALGTAGGRAAAVVLLCERRALISSATGGNRQSWSPMPSTSTLCTPTSPTIAPGPGGIRTNASSSVSSSSTSWKDPQR